MKEFNWMTIFSPISLGAFAAFVILGIFAVIGFFTKQKQDIEEKAEQSSQYLIGVLQGTVNELKEKVKNQTDALNEAEGKITTLQAENKLFKEVFEGRDDTMQKFMKDGFAAMQQVPTIIDQLKAQNDSIEKLITTFAQKPSVQVNTGPTSKVV